MLQHFLSGDNSREGFTISGVKAGGRWSEKSMQDQDYPHFVVKETRALWGSIPGPRLYRESQHLTAALPGSKASVLSLHHSASHLP